jgi:hypothetical protein
MANFGYAECQYAECRYAASHSAECRYTLCHYAECRGASKTAVSNRLAYREESAPKKKKKFAAKF